MIIMLRKSFIINLCIIAFIVILLFDKAFLIVIPLTVILILDLRYIYIFLLSIPLIESFISLPGFTISSGIGALYVIIFFFKLIKSNISINFDRISFKYYLVATLLVFGAFNAYISSVISSEYLTAAILKENVLCLFKVLVSIFLYIDISRSKNDISSFMINKLPNIIGLFFLLIFIKLQLNPVVVVSWGEKRFGFENVNQNDLASLIAVYMPLVFLIVKSKKSWLFFISSFISGVLSVFMTLSRGGIITLIISILFALYFIKSISRKMTIIVILIISVLITIFMNSYIDSIQSRFLGSYEARGISGLTTMRTDIWKNGITETVNKSPIIGFGNTVYTGISINERSSLGRGFVMHSIFFEILVRFGLLGLIVFGITFISPIIYFVKNKNLLFNKQVFFLLHMLILIAGLGLSWLYLEVLWINLAFCYGIVKRSS